MWWRPTDKIPQGTIFAGIILLFLTPKEVATAAVAYPQGKEDARALHNNGERQDLITRGHLHLCVKIMQDTDTEPGEYEKIEVPEEGINVREWVGVVNDDNTNRHSNSDDLTNMRERVVTCHKDRTCIAVYMLLDKLGYGLLVLMKGRTNSI
jgi:hypothetical protein